MDPLERGSPWLIGADALEMGAEPGATVGDLMAHLRLVDELRGEDALERAGRLRFDGSPEPHVLKVGLQVEANGGRTRVTGGEHTEEQEGDAAARGGGSARDAPGSGSGGHRPRLARAGRRLQKVGSPWQGLGAMRRRVRYPIGTALAVLAWTGCATMGGAVGFVGSDPEAASVKLLAPHAVGRSCRTSVFGVRLAPGEPSLEEAMRQIFARDAEGNVVTSAVVRWRVVTTGVYNRRCVEVRGDLGRLISTVVLPMSHRHDGG